MHHLWHSYYWQNFKFRVYAEVYFFRGATTTPLPSGFRSPKTPELSRVNIINSFNPELIIKNFFGIPELISEIKNLEYHHSNYREYLLKYCLKSNKWPLPAKLKFSPTSWWKYNELLFKMADSIMVETNLFVKKTTIFSLKPYCEKRFLTFHPK